MSILEILPPEIFRIILQFLELPEELIPLDNAILNHRLRSDYLRAMYGMTLMNDVYPGTSKGDMELVWLLNKRILPTSLCFFTFDQDSYPMTIDQSRLVLQSLSILNEDQKIDALFETLGHFPSLINLDIFSIDSTTSSHFVHFLSLHPQLKKLSVPYISTPSPDFIHGILQVCPNLTNLSVSRIGWFGDDCVSLLLQAGLSKLENLVLDYTSVQQHDSIVNLLNRFPHLKCLTIEECPVSINTRVYFLNEYALPRLRSGDAELQKIGVLGVDQVVVVRRPNSCGFAYFPIVGR
jgi:hypothetical protein